MNCPKCGSQDVKVGNTLPYEGIKIYRQRKCKTCSHRWRTVEILDDGSRNFKYEYSAAMQVRYGKHGGK